MNVDILKLALQDFLGNEPVQEGVQMDLSQTALVNKNPMLWDSSQQKEQPPPVSMETDYSVQEDCLNAVVNVDCLKPSLPKTLERTPSVENLFIQLKQPQDGDEVDGGGMEVEEVTLNADIAECDQSFNAALRSCREGELNEEFEKVLEGDSGCLQAQPQYQQAQPQYQQAQPQYQQAQPQYQQAQPQYQQVQLQCQELPTLLCDLPQMPSFSEPQQKTSATNIACTLEYTQENRLQVTQVPESVNPVHYEWRQVTNVNMPNLEVLKRPPKEELPSPVSSEEFDIFESFVPNQQSPPTRVKVEDELKPVINLEADDLLCKAEHIKAELGRIRGNPSDTTKVQVPDFVLFALQHKYCDCRYDLSNLFSLCDRDGRTDSKECDHFVATDTKAIGQLWQVIKGNRHSNYDTFARGLRVGRERQKGIIDYLDSGKGTKKRIYKLSAKGLQELQEMRQKLRHPR